MGYSRYVGRVGALAIALGIGTAVASTSGIACAETETGSAGSSVERTTAGADDSNYSDSGLDAADTQSVDGDESADAGDDPGLDEDVDIDSEFDSDADIADGDEEDSAAEELVGFDNPEAELVEPVEDRSERYAAEADRVSSTPVEHLEAVPPRPEPGSEVVDDVLIDLGDTEPFTADDPMISAEATDPGIVEETRPVSAPPTASTEQADLASIASPVISPFDAFGTDIPAESPLLWGLLAFARRQLGQREKPALEGAFAPGASAIDDNNAAPTGWAWVGSPGWFTGKVSGQVFGFDRDFDRVTYAGSTNTAKGSVVVDSRGRFTYTPTDAARHAAAKDGATEADTTDSFVVTIDDGNGGLTGVEVSVRIRAANSRPRSSGSVGLPAMDTGAVTGTIVTRDADGDVLSYRASGLDKGDVVFGDDGSFVYTPTPQAREDAGRRPGWSWDRQDTFAVTVDDGHGGTDTVRFTVQIAALDNEGPELEDVVQGDPSSWTATVTGRVLATDADNDRLTYAGSTETDKGRVVVYSSGRFSYRPTAEARHAAAVEGAGAEATTDSFNVTVTDGFGGALTVPVTVNIAPHNSDPRITRVRATTPDENSGEVTVALTARDLDGDDLTFSAPASTGKGALVDNGDGTFTYTPTLAARVAAGAEDAPDAAKTDVLSFAVSDGHGGTDSASVTVTIVPAVGNAAPVDGEFTASPPNSDGVVSGVVSATDPNGDALTFSGTTSTAKGSVVVDPDGSFTYTPTADARHEAAASGASTADKQDSFDVTVDDGNGGTLVVAVTVPVSPANTAPVASYTAGQPNSVDGVVAGLVTGSDPDGDTVTFTGPVTSVKGGTVVLDSATGQFSYTPTPAARDAAAMAGATPADKSDSFAVVVGDGHGGTDTVTVSVAVLPAPNSAPSNGNAVVGQPGSAGVVTGTVSASDANGDTLTFVGSTTTSKGSVVVNADGSFVYTPTEAARHAASASAASPSDKQDSFDVTVSDGRGGTLAVPVTVTIAPSNSAPAATYTAGQPNSDTGVVAGIVSGSDPDGDVLSYSAPATSARGGAITLNTATGQFSYVPTQAARDAAAAPDATAADKVDTFTVLVDDAHGGATAVSVTVDVAPAFTIDGTQFPGAAAGPVQFAADGTGYLTLFNQSSDGSLDMTVVIIPTAGAPFETDPIPGSLPFGAPILRPSGDLFLVNLAGLAAGTAKTAISLVRSDGSVTTQEVLGSPYTAAQFAQDGTAYLTVLTVVDRGDGTGPIPRMSVVRVTPEGQFSTHDTGFAAAAAYIPPGSSQAVPSIVVGPDGTAYQAFMASADPTSAFYRLDQVGILVIPPSGDSVVSTVVQGSPYGAAAALADGTARLTVNSYAEGPVVLIVDSNRVSRVLAADALPLGNPATGQHVSYLVVNGETGATLIRIAADGTQSSIALPGDPAPIYDVTQPQLTAQSYVAVGPDDRAYVLFEGELRVYGPAGAERVIPVDGPLGALRFGEDGTPFGLLMHEDFDTAALVNLSTGVATDPIPVGSGGTVVLVTGPDNSAVFASAITDYDTGATVGTAVALIGSTAIDIPLGGGQVSSAVFGPDGRAYVNAVTYDLDTSTGTVTSATTTVYAVDAGGAAVVFAGDGIGSTSIRDGKIYLTLTDVTNAPDVVTVIRELDVFSPSTEL
ncbi:Ig-like domain-containing protein [uncultured Mycolicibacterium sp.]|uniref:Ig-like domain-containing protein n=1 Tax=uncultured Mycolicibacterium sp. TaxID=2320817 RepID=UPI0032B22091